MKILYNTLTQTLRPYPRADDEDVVGLSEEYLPLVVVEIEAPNFDNQTERLVPTQVINTKSGTVTKGWSVESIQLPPVWSVTMRSLRLALIDANLYQATVATINSIPDDKEKLKAQIWWTTSPTVNRNNAYVLSIASAMSKSEQDIDKIFESAKLLDLQ